MSSLFRTEAVEARRSRAAGDIVLASPVSYRLLGAMAFALAAVLVVFLALGTYTRHVTLAGQLVPDRGVVSVPSPAAGAIVEKHVEEGGPVERGDVLFVISGERTSAALGETHALIGERLEARRRSLLAQIDETQMLERADEAALTQRTLAMEDELARLDGMLETQRARVALAEEAGRRYAEMRAAGFVSGEQLDAKREALLDHRARLSGLERERAQLERQLADVRSELENLPLHYRQQVAELERAVASVDLEVTENEARRKVAVIAPVGGIATALGGGVGQLVEAGAPLVTIVPRDSRLLAELRAPSRAIGFIDSGSEVLLRYAAYPYQQFGHHEGRVVAVSRATLPVDGPPGPAPPGHEPIYRVVVGLDSQAVDVYGESRPLRAGMLVEADVKLETRRLYEWVLEPLHAMRVRASGSGSP